MKPILLLALLVLALILAGCEKKTYRTIIVNPVDTVFVPCDSIPVCPDSCGNHEHCDDGKGEDCDE